MPIDLISTRDDPRILFFEGGSDPARCFSCSYPIRARGKISRNPHSGYHSAARSFFSEIACPQCARRTGHRPGRVPGTLPVLADLQEHSRRHPPAAELSPQRAVLFSGFMQRTGFNDRPGSHSTIFKNYFRRKLPREVHFRMHPGPEISGVFGIAQDVMPLCPANYPEIRRVPWQQRYGPIKRCLFRSRTLLPFWSGFSPDSGVNVA
jgi:hypothetical protein